MGLLVLVLALNSVASAATCPVQDLGLTASADGALATTDCRLRDVDTGVRTTTYVNQYRVTVTQTGVLTARLSSTAFNTVLLLYSAEGKQIVSNDDADGSTNSRITISLAAGKYILIATSRTLGTGAYSLKTSFESQRS